VLGHGGFGAFIWDEVGGARTIDPLPLHSQVDLRDLSADGSTVVGRSRGVEHRAFIWDEVNGTRDLGDLTGDYSLSAYGVSADGSTVVGSAPAPAGQEAYVWDPAGGILRLGFLPGGGAGGGSGAFALSGDGSVVAGYSVTPTTAEGFAWDAANGMRGFGDLGGAWPQSIAFDVSDDGSVVVGTGAGDEAGTQTFIWDEENGMRDLVAMLAAGGIDLSGWQMGFVPRDHERPSVSGDGRTVVGFGFYQGQRASYVAFIPEPSTAVLLGFGLALCSGISGRNAGAGRIAVSRG